MGSAVPPVDGGSERTQLDIKVRDPWSSGVRLEHAKVGRDQPFGHKQGLRNRTCFEPPPCGNRQNAPTTLSQGGGGRDLWPRGGWYFGINSGEEANNRQRVGGGLALGNAQPERKQVKRHLPEDEENTHVCGQPQYPEQNGRGLTARKTRLKGPASISEASLLARNRSWRATARKVLKGKFYSVSTAATKSSKRKTIMEVALACTEEETIFPVSVELLVDVAATINYTEMRSGEQYMYELKMMHTELGFPWTDQLERHLQMCKRALMRDRGPDARAVEYKPDSIEVERFNTLDTERGCPQSTALSYAWSAIWMLRAIEAKSLLVGHVTLDRRKSTVKLFIPKSKMDQKSLGVTRNLACCGKVECETLCPWAIALLVLSKLRVLKPSAPLFPSIQDKKLSQYNLVKSWALKLDGSITGHSARRSGAMRYARLGWNIQDIAFLGRWKSSAVFRYIEQALQDVPANLRAPTSTHATGGQPDAEQIREKVIKVREVADNNLRDRLTSTEAKFQQLDCRLTALEDAKEQGPKMLDYQRGTLWALSKGRSGRLLHVVKQASWNLPLQDWSTSCGWKFAKRNVKVELTRNPDETTRRCEKCEELEKLRDKVNGGVELAQLVEIWLPTKQLDHQGVKQQHQEMFQQVDFHQPFKRSALPLEGGWVWWMKMK